MAVKKYPIPNRFSAALSEKAYINLRELNKKYGYGNNYILTLILENLETVIDEDSMDKVFKDFEKEYGSPKK